MKRWQWEQTVGSRSNLPDGLKAIFRIYPSQGKPFNPGFKLVFHNNLLEGDELVGGRRVGRPSEWRGGGGGGVS